MADQHVASGDGRTPATTSAWAPFRQRWFAAMWSAQFVSNIGSWTQTVGAQWLMLSLWAAPCSGFPPNTSGCRLRC
jgi:hypothetical protein